MIIVLFCPQFSFIQNIELIYKATMDKKKKKIRKRVTKDFIILRILPSRIDP